MPKREFLEDYNVYEASLWGRAVVVRIGGGNVREAGFLRGTQLEHHGCANSSNIILVTWSRGAKSLNIIMVPLVRGTNSSKIILVTSTRGANSLKIIIVTWARGASPSKIIMVPWARGVNSSKTIMARLARGANSAMITKFLNIYVGSLWASNRSSSISEQSNTTLIDAHVGISASSNSIYASMCLQVYSIFPATSAHAFGDLCILRRILSTVGRQLQWHRAFRMCI